MFLFTCLTTTAELDTRSGFNVEKIQQPSKGAFWIRTKNKDCLSHEEYLLYWPRTEMVQYSIRTDTRLWSWPEGQVEPPEDLIVNEMYRTRKIVLRKNWTQKNIALLFHDGMIVLMRCTSRLSGARLIFVSL